MKNFSGSFATASAIETEELGREFSSVLAPGDCVGLLGELGSGKTRFTRGVALGLGARGHVKSPSFTILNIYEGGRLPLYHMDLYRLSTGGEFLEAGLEEFIYGKGVSVIEWADKIPEILKACSYVIEFACGDGDSREIIFKNVSG